MSRTFGLLFLAALGLSAQIHTIEGPRIRSHVKFLASDQLEGRGVGSRGGQLAVEYLAAQLESAGVKPAGDNSTYFQKVPLTNVTMQEATLSATGAEGKQVNFKWLDQWVGTSNVQQPTADVETDAVFVGHGITAPEFGWDDYGTTDVRGKVVVLFTNEPPSTDEKFFGGKALTYYGRWSYKYEQALRKGAVGAIIVHTTPTAGYGWNVVRGSWSREQPQVRRAKGAPALSLVSWVTTEGGAGLFSLAGRNVEEMLKIADTKGFKPVPLNIRVRAKLNMKLDQIESANVVGKVEGSDPTAKQEAVVFSAHWDHLGVGEPVNGDSIYNGAVDNATGCGMLLEMARAWASLSPRPRRSALFVFVTAEESGLLGSQYFGEHPVVPAGKLALNLNFDAFYPFGKTSEVVVNGAERTSFWPVVQSMARRYQYGIQPDPHPEQGHYYRSDHFSMAKVGVPSFSINMGSRFEGKPADYGERIFQEYNERSYHQPSDEYKDSWDFTGMEHIARFGMALGLEAANMEKLPTWQAGDEFLSTREKSLAR